MLHKLVRSKCWHYNATFRRFQCIWSTPWWRTSSSITIQYYVMMKGFQAIQAWHLKCNASMNSSHHLWSLMDNKPDVYIISNYEALSCHLVTDKENKPEILVVSLVVFYAWHESAAVPWMALGRWYSCWLGTEVSLHSHYRGKDGDMVGWVCRGYLTYK